MKIFNLKSKSGIHRLISREDLLNIAHKARALEVVKLPEICANDIFTFYSSVIKGGLDKSNVNSSKVSVLGGIAAGTPIEAIQQEVDKISLPEELQSQSFWTKD